MNAGDAEIPADAPAVRPGRRRVPPSGEVTFFFTDVEGSTSLWERQPEQMQLALAEHDRRLHEAIDAEDGYVFTTAGDSFAAAFSTAGEALRAAVAAQQMLVEPCGDLVVRVRMGLHSGAAAVREGDYFGAAVNRCARIMSAGHGGQILLSQATVDRVSAHLDVDAELIDLGEHRLKDLLRSERIHQFRQPGLDEHFGPLRTLGSSANNLPTQLTHFIGREQELADVGSMLSSNRLVTLLGSGGSGKTRLALQAAADAVEDYPDGIRLVELAALSDPKLIADEVAERVGAQLSADTPTIDSIARTIGTKRMLIVTDNCEHLVEPASELAGKLLQMCPSIKILTTSRELLGISGESFYRVPSLDVPDTADAVEAQRSDAVQLFIDRGMLAKPGFAVTPDNVEAVVAICRRLDGIPLAIELAAARLRVLSPAQIASRLDERFRLLGGPTRNAVKRHHTLEATIDWSYDHLSVAEQALFRRAATFAGNFSLEAAEAVCVGDDVDEFSVLDILTFVVDKSMIVPEDSGDGVNRYRLLESMRVYGRAKLVDAGEADAAAVRHASHFADVARALQSTQRAGHLGQALTGLDADEDNLRAALRNSLDTDHLDNAARIVGAIGYLWYASGSFREGIEWCRELFDRDMTLPDDLLAPALHSYGTLLGSWEQPEAGAEMLQREVVLCRRLGNPARLAAALNNLGNLLHDLWRTEEANELLREAIMQFRAADESPSLALSSLGYASLHAGDLDDAERLYTEALEEARDDYGRSLATTYLGECAVHQGRTAEARTRCEAARNEFATLKVTPGIVYNDFLLAFADRADGDLPSAARRLVAALEHPDAHWYLAAKFWILQAAAAVVDDPTVGAVLLGVAEQHYDSVGEPQHAFITADLERTGTLLRDSLGSDEYGAQHSAGRHRDPSDAVALARTHLARRAGQNSPS